MFQQQFREADTRGPRIGIPHLDTGLQAFLRFVITALIPQRLANRTQQACPVGTRIEQTGQTGVAFDERLAVAPLGLGRTVRERMNEPLHFEEARIRSAKVQPPHPAYGAVIVAGAPGWLRQKKRRDLPSSEKQRNREYAHDNALVSDRKSVVEGKR